MWQTNSLWFDVAVVMSIFAVGNILFGHFEQHKAKWRRVLKVVIVVGVGVTLSATMGRIWAYGVLCLPLVAAAIVHLWWLPRHGINGWTGEPREKYLELINAKRS
jgi:quinol-cytochrome oxidoreductase complex cytochrome b subunit